MVLLTLALAAILIGQWRLAIALGPPQPIGDEGHYLRRASHVDPHHSKLFIRVPLFVACFVWAHKLTGKPETVSWLFLAAGLTAALGSAVAAHLAGLNAVWVAAAFLLAPELLIFNLRYWPEPMLALASGMITILLWQFSYVHGLFIGLIAAAAVMIRFEQLVLIPAVGIAWIWAGADKSLWDWTGLVVPASVCLGLWTLRNWRRYRLAWPDTTWQFNLAIAHRESRQMLLSPVNIQQTVLAEMRDRLADKADGAQAVPQCIPWDPGFLKMPLRWLAVLGRETFISERLLPPSGQGFPSAEWDELRRRWVRYGFTLLACISVCIGLLTMRFEPYLTPSLALFVAIASFHVRTRYRAILQPGLALWFADGISHIDFGQSWVPWLSLLFAVMLAIKLGSVTLRVEH